MNISSEELEQLKREFVEWWIRFPTEPYKAACIVFPKQDEIGARLTVVQDWIHDPYVLKYKIALLNSDVGENLLPSKNELMADLYDIAKRSHDDSAKIKAIEAYAKLAGHIKQPGVNINTNNNIGNNITQSVMLVPDYGSDEEWQESLMIQQRDLISKDIDVLDAETIE